MSLLKSPKIIKYPWISLSKKVDGNMDAQITQTSITNTKINNLQNQLDNETAQLGKDASFNNLSCSSFDLNSLFTSYNDKNLIGNRYNLNIARGLGTNSIQKFVPKIKINETSYDTSNWLLLHHNTYDGNIGKNYPYPECALMMSNLSSKNYMPWNYYVGVVKDEISTGSTGIRMDIGYANNVSTPAGTGDSSFTPAITTRVVSGNKLFVGIGNVQPREKLHVTNGFIRCDNLERNLVLITDENKNIKSSSITNDQLINLINNMSNKIILNGKITSNSSGVTVNFTQSFSTEPTVTMTPYTSDDRICVITNITTSGFSFLCKNSKNGDNISNVECNWIAVGDKSTS